MIVMCKSIMKAMIIALPGAVVSPCMSQDRIEMEAITVIGNKETPNQLYIVPWESDGLAHMSEPAISGEYFEDTALPVERNLMLR